MNVRDCTDVSARGDAVIEAVRAISAGQLIVLPTDTVYGLAADARDPAAVALLQLTKGRGRHMPPPVLAADAKALRALAAEVSPAALALMEAFWPGGLTLVLPVAPHLRWDLGDLEDTIAVRVPDHAIARELLAATGPLAVTSANITGQPPALTVDAAFAQLGPNVTVYLDGGPVPGGIASSVVDLAHGQPRVLRPGAIGLERLRDVVPDMADGGEPKG